MKLLNRFSFLLAMVLILAPMHAAFCQSNNPSSTNTTSASPATNSTDKKADIPSSTDMSLKVVNQKNVMPDGFRGSKKGTGNLQWLEDVGYLMAENSNLYNVNAGAIAKAAKFTSKPSITWEVKKDDGNGDMQSRGADETDKASKTCNITEPGYYEVHNGGARRVASADDDGSNTVKGSNPGNSSSGSNSTGSSTNSNSNQSAGGGSSVTSGSTGTTGQGAQGASGKSKTVTAQQVVGIQVHDCTSPDVWVAFEECAGSANAESTEDALKSDIATKIVKAKGNPFSTKKSDFNKVSYIFLDEGAKRNKIPWEKTERVSVAGPLFSEHGIADFKQGVIPSKMDPKDYRNHVNIIGGGNQKSPIKGIFVRRNVPFIVAAVSTDNANKRKNAKNVTSIIAKRNEGKDLKKDGTYLFRVPNYPRSEYKDQPDYYYSVTSTDKEGNVTTMKMPVYVVNGSVAYEDGRSQ